MAYEQHDLEIIEAQAKDNDGAIRAQNIGARVFFASYQGRALGYAGTPQASLSMVLHAKYGTGTYDRNPKTHMFSRRCALASHSRRQRRIET